MAIKSVEKCVSAHSVSKTTCALLLLAKFPVPGEVKTRLVNGTKENGLVGLRHAKDRHDRAIGEDMANRMAAQLYRAFLIDRFRAHRGREYDLFLGTSQPEHAHAFREITGPDVMYQPAIGSNLGNMMHGIFSSLLRRYRKGIISGSDIPWISEETIERVIKELGSHEVVLVPALDGAYNMIGMSEPHNIFAIKKWSSGSELQETIALLRSRNIKHAVLEDSPIMDVDTIEDLWVLLEATPKESAHETSEALKVVRAQLKISE